MKRHDRFLLRQRVLEIACEMLEQLGEYSSLGEFRESTGISLEAIELLFGSWPDLLWEAGKMQELGESVETLTNEELMELMRETLDPDGSESDDADE